MEPRILNFVPASTIRTGPLQRARPLVLCAGTVTRQATTRRARITRSPASLMRAARPWMPSWLHEIMNITDEMAATDAEKVKAMRTSVCRFSSPSCALIHHQCSKYVALTQPLHNMLRIALHENPM
eukprot:2437320-Pleurochrysis_carterae.AAC.1